MIQKILDHKFSLKASYRLIAILGIIYFMFNTRVIATAMPLSLLGYKIFSFFGINFDSFTLFPDSLKNSITESSFLNPVLVLIFGYMIGIWLVSLAKEPYRLKDKISLRKFMKLAMGGLFVGIGVQCIYGANIGEVYGAISMLSLSGWIVVIGSGLGLWIGKPLFNWFEKTDK